MIRDPDSPAGYRWRIGWLAGTAVRPPPEPAPEPARSRSRFRDSIRVELHREAELVYFAAQQEVRRQCRLCARELEHHRHAV